MTFNKISRLPVIGDLAGVYFVYNTDTPSINGIYVKSTNESAAIKMADVAETLNGSNYLMVYGTGTPTENAAELQAAYEEAKKMPRHLGTFNSGSFITIYKGQTFVNSSIPIKFFIATTDFTGTIGAAPVGTFEGRDLQSELDAALARRVSVIVAPGEYDFGATAFVVNTPYINIVSLTGRKDVLINTIDVSSDYVYVSGINCGTSPFNVSSGLSNIIIENCEGGDFSFCSSGGNASGKFNNCIGGDFSFGGGGGNASGKFNNCIGGDFSFGSNTFGGGTLTGILINCRRTTGTFPTPTGEGKIYNCIDGDGNLINTPLPIFADNAAAASLAVGTMYRTATGVQMIKY